MEACPICNQQLIPNPYTKELICNNKNCFNYRPINSEDFDKHVDRMNKIFEIESEIFTLYQPLIKLGSKIFIYKIKKIISAIIIFCSGYLIFKDIQQNFYKEDLIFLISIFLILIGSFLYFRNSWRNSIHIETLIDERKDLILEKIYELQKIDLLGRKIKKFEIYKMKYALFHDYYGMKIEKD